MINHEQQTIALASRRDYTGRGVDTFRTRRLPLQSALADRGFRMIVLDGAKDHVEGGVFSRHYIFDDKEVEQIETAVSPLAGLDLSGGLAKLQLQNLPALNPISVRELGKSKSRQYELLGDLMPASVEAKSSVTAIHDAIESIASERVVVKSNFDPGKTLPVIIGARHGIRERINAFVSLASPNSDVLVQEYMPEVEGGFHPELVFNDDESALRKQLGGRGEVRMHYIDGQLIASHARQDTEGTDKWLFFDQSSLPQTMKNIGNRAASLFFEKTHEPDIYLAVDVTPDGSRIVEVNTRNPGVMMPQPNRPGEQLVHEQTTGAIADKLVSMANRRHDG